MRITHMLLLLVLMTTPVAAQDTVTRRNPLAKDGPATGNPLAKDGSASGNPLARDAWSGTWSGTHALGTISIEIKRDGEGYAVIDRTSKPMNGTATLDPDGSLKGEYVVKLLGLTRRHRIELRQEEGGLRYRTTAVNTLLRKQ